MAKIVRYNGNLVPFASSSLGTERTIFGQVTQANDITSQFTAQFLRGWGIVGPSDQPTLQDFNAISYTHGQILSYLHQVGVPEYNAAQEYHLNSFVNSGGILYVSLVNSNVGNTPVSSPASWVPYSKGGLANTQRLIATGTVTKTAGVKKWKVRVYGGGGQGGGTQATGASQIAAGGGGSSGSYAEAEFDVSAISSASLVIGAGGNAAAAGATGTAGGSSTLTMGANSITCPGGPGGIAGAATSSLPNEGGSAAAFSSAPTHVGALSFTGTPGGGATSGLLFSLAAAQPGNGGPTALGSSRSIGGASGNAAGFGAGGAAARALINSSANNGFFGANGLCIIEEYF